MGGARNYQEQVLDEALSRKKPITIFLAKGVRVEGLVRMHDAYTILLETEEGQVLVYKRAITSLFPARLYHNVPSAQNRPRDKKPLAAPAEPEKT